MPTRKQLTKNDPVYKFIVDFQKKYGRPPSQKEIREACHLVDVNYRLNRLCESGLLNRIPVVQISYEILKGK